MTVPTAAIWPVLLQMFVIGQVKSDSLDLNRVNNKMLEYDWLLTALIYGLIGCFILPPPCIPVKFLFRFRFVAFTLCVVVSGSEVVPVQ